MPLQRRHHIDGQFADADFKSETWVCGSPACKNIFFPKQTREDIREHLDLKCWSCGYKAFCEEVETVVHEENVSTEINDDSCRAKDDDQEPTVKVCDEEVLHPDDSHRKDESKISDSARELDREKASQEQARDVPPLKAEKEPDSAFTKIKPMPLKSNDMKKKSAKMGQLDINSNIAKKRGGFEGKVEVVKSEDVKPFSTRPVCTCPHPCSSSKGTCPLHPTTQSNFLHASKSTSAVSQKESSLRGSMPPQKSQTHSGSSSADSTSAFPGCTCPSFHLKSKEDGRICQVHPNLHHLRQPTLPANFGRRRRIDK